MNAENRVVFHVDIEPRVELFKDGQPAGQTPAGVSLVRSTGPFSAEGQEFEGLLVLCTDAEAEAFWMIDGVYSVARCDGGCDATHTH